VALTPIAEAQAALVAAVPRMPVVAVPLDDARGLVSARDVVAEQTVPPFANCSLDGYAVRHDDVAGAPVELRVLGMVPAGSVAPSPVEPGTAWKVMTGAPLPEGADTVVMVELTSATPAAPLASAGDVVRIHEAPARGAGVRAAGSDVKPGDRVLTAGEVLTAPRLAVLAGIGVRRIEVPRRPRVGVLVTGDELVTDPRPLRAGEIYESNGVMVRALVADSGCEVVDLGVGRDDADDMVERLTKAAAACDVVITTGGVSMGDTDPVKAALDQLGRLHWLQVSMRPAKPFAYALLDGPERAVPVFGLPGNPVSSLVSFEVLVRPALRAMTGHRELDRPRVLAVADEPMRALGTDGRTTMLRVEARYADDGRLHVQPVGGAQESHQIAASARADALAELAPGSSYAPGDDVPVRMLRWDH